MQVIVTFNRSRVFTPLLVALLLPLMLTSPSLAQWQKNGKAHYIGGGFGSPTLLPLCTATVNGVSPGTPIPTDVDAPSTTASLSCPNTASGASAEADETVMQSFIWMGTDPNAVIPPPNFTLSLNLASSASGSAYAYGAESTGSYPDIQPGQGGVNMIVSVTAHARAGTKNVVGTPTNSNTDVYYNGAQLVSREAVPLKFNDGKNATCTSRISSYVTCFAIQQTVSASASSTLTFK